MVFTKNTFVGAIKILEWEFYPEGAMNTDRFLSFLQKIIFHHHIRNHLFIFDNAGTHKNSRIRQLIKFKEPIKGKGFRSLFRRSGYKVYMVDESLGQVVGVINVKGSVRHSDGVRIRSFGEKE
jgi:hypothetical protein